LEDKTHELLTQLVKEVEDLSLRIPDSLVDGSLESALKEISTYLSPVEPVKSAGFVVYTPLYQGLKEEAKMLAALAEALRLRMEHLGRTDLSGVDYFKKKLNEFLRRLRASLGYNPDLPLSLKDWKPREV
jgi:hypothetical protein